jgi:hypothetical protein
MNKDKVKELMKQAGTDTSGKWMGVDHVEKLLEAITLEFIDILETEIKLVKGYQSTACNNFDFSWHEGKIEHLKKLIDKSKDHFGVDK